MALNTKLKLNDSKAEQLSGQTLTLSGNTIVADSGDLKYAIHPTFTEDTQIIDKKYVDDNIVSGVTGGTTYNLLSPAAVEVGGITEGYILTGKTTNEILQDMLYPEICGTLTAPSVSSMTLSPSTSTLEVGTEITTLNVTANFCRGSIDPQGCSASAFRSGPANSYCFTGAQTNASYPSTAISMDRTVNNYVIVEGSNTWGSCVSFDAGVQPKSNKDNNFDSPLAAGTTPPASISISGILPYFYGVSDSAPTPGSALIATGTKVVAGSDNQININFGTNTGKYLWFATPFDSIVKQGWSESAFNFGNIGTSPSDIWNAPVTETVDSPETCWTGENYRVYATNLPTNTSGTVFCMTNNTQQ